MLHAASELPAHPHPEEHNRQLRRLKLVPRMGACTHTGASRDLLASEATGHLHQMRPEHFTRLMDCRGIIKSLL